MNRSATKIVVAALVLVLLAVAPACDPDDNIGGLVPVCIFFTPAKVPTDGEVVAVVDAELSDCDQAVIQLSVQGVGQVWGVNVELDYPSGIAQWIPVIDVSTSFLGPESELLVSNPSAAEDPLGHVEISVARNDVFHSAGVDPDDAGNPVLLRIGFVRFASGGSGDMTFDPDEVSLSFRLMNQPPTIDDTIVFSGGTLFIQ